MLINFTINTLILTKKATVVNSLTKEMKNFLTLTNLKYLVKKKNQSQLKKKEGVTINSLK